MTTLTVNRVALSSSTHFIFAMLTLAVLVAPRYLFAQTGYRDSESFRADLLTVLQLQKKIHQDIQGQSAASNSTLALVERAINEADALTPQELQVLQNINFSFAPAIESLKALDNAVTAAKDRSELQAKTEASTVTFECDGYVEAAGELVDPPGPCGQMNYQPTQPPTGGFQLPVELTDNEYPSFFGCTSYYPKEVVVLSRAATIANEVIATVARRLCDQIFTVAGVGTNTALACIVTDVAYLAQKGIKENIANCHSFRIASEGTSTYVRAGELFVQSRQNTNTIVKRADDGFDESQNGLSDIRNQVEENSRRIEQTIETINEVLKTIGIENSRLLDEDPDFDNP